MHNVTYNGKYNKYNVFAIERVNKIRKKKTQGIIPYSFKLL